MVQLNGVSPVWILLCITKLTKVLNDLLQSWQKCGLTEHGYCCPVDFAVCSTVPSTLLTVTDLTMKHEFSLLDTRHWRCWSPEVVAWPSAHSTDFSKLTITWIHRHMPVVIRKYACFSFTLDAYTKFVMKKNPIKVNYCISKLWNHTGFFLWLRAGIIKQLVNTW